MYKSGCFKQNKPQFIWQFAKKVVSLYRKKIRKGYKTESLIITSVHFGYCNKKAPEGCNRQGRRKR